MNENIEMNNQNVSKKRKFFKNRKYGQKSRYKKHDNFSNSGNHGNFRNSGNHEDYSNFGNHDDYSNSESYNVGSYNNVEGTFNPDGCYDGNESVAKRPKINFADDFDVDELPLDVDPYFVAPVQVIFLSQQ